MQTLIINASVVTKERVLENHCILTESGKIQAVFPNAGLANPDPQTDIFDAQGAYLAPGFIDMHIHGFAGFGVEDGTEDALLKMSSELAKHGVTGFCPTLYCGQPKDMETLLQNTVGAFGRERGAHLIGYHLEGPFISPHKPGVMKPQDIAPVNLDVLKRLYDAARGHIASMTVAPELPGIEDVIHFCEEKNILLQSGHTDASYETFLRAAHLGIRHSTHLFNAMRAFNHRAPGAAGAVLMSPDISAEIIADGVHVHPDVVRFLKRVKPVKNIVLVTDALKPTAQKKPPFIANGEEMVFKDGVWRRQTDLVIGGSALTMIHGVQNLVEFGYTLPEAVQCASANPARLLGLARKGTIAPGFDADLVLFDRAFVPLKTWLA